MLLFVDSTRIMETDFIKPVSIKALESVMLEVPMVILRKNLVAVMDLTGMKRTTLIIP